MSNDMTRELAEALRMIRVQFGDYKDGDGAAKFHACRLADEVLARYQSATPNDPSQTLAQAAAARSVEQLAYVVRNVIDNFDQLGFDDPEAPVNGGDCVDVVCQVLPPLRTAIAVHDRYLPEGAAPANNRPAEAEERKRLSEFLIKDWENSFADNADAAFAAVAETLLDGHVGYRHMPIEHLRHEAENAGFDDELGDEPGGMKP